MTNRKPALNRLAACIGLLATACSTLPDWSPQEAREYAVVVEYDGAAQTRLVPLPTSNRNLTVFELTSLPEDLPQSYSPTDIRDRRLHLPAGTEPVQVFCRFRVFRQHDARGRPLPWPAPRDLFPGAARVLSGTDATNGE